MSQNQTRYNVPKNSNQNSNQKSGNGGDLLKVLTTIFTIGSAIFGALGSKK